MELRVGSVIKEIRLQSGIEQKELAEKAGISPSFLNDIEKGRSNPAIDTFCRIATELGQNPGRLLNKAMGIESYTRMIPVLGRIRAGIPIFAEENYEGSLEIPSDIVADFALRVQGDSMIGAGILDGDYAICRRAERAGHGQVVVAVRYVVAEYAEATLKYFCTQDGRFVLRAANPEYPDIDFQEEGWRIAGVMVALLRYRAPDYALYKNYISTQEYALRDWNAVIEKAIGYGVKPLQLEALLDMYWEMAKRQRG